MKKNNIRFITAAALFDGHDVSINIIRRILQSFGCEVIHLGHNRSVDEVFKAAIEEDVNGIAVSSYQGGHNEYFSYLLDKLQNASSRHIKIFGGGGGVITPSEIEKLEKLGLTKIFSPNDGAKLGLKGMISQMVEISDFDILDTPRAQHKDERAKKIAQQISFLERNFTNQESFQASSLDKKAPIVGITGTGGAGKSTLIDEILLRFINSFPDKKVALLSVDPSHSKNQGALLGDRIRMTCASHKNVFMRSLATRTAHSSVSPATKVIANYLASLDFDVVFVETSGIGQSDSIIEEISDLSMYVMTPEYGAPSQLEKISMLDYADVVVINKFDRPKSLDALKDVQKAMQRSQQKFHEQPSNMLVFATNAAIFGDLGVNKVFNNLVTLLKGKSSKDFICEALPEGKASRHPLIKKDRQQYLFEISQAVKKHHEFFNNQQDLVAQKEALEVAYKIIPQNEIAQKIAHTEEKIDPELKEQLQYFEQKKEELQRDSSQYQVRGKWIKTANYKETLSGLKIPKIAVPLFHSKAEIVNFLGKENFPGAFPFTAGVFPFKRDSEDPTRMFAGEGLSEKTNQRFHFLSRGQKAKRLSTAFDSVTLYGQDPDTRPDIFGKIGNAGVSVCCLDDAKRLYSGFDLSSNNVSVSLTINGPSPTITAFFFNAAIDFACEKELKKQGLWEETTRKIQEWFKKNGQEAPKYRLENLPQEHDGSGLGFLGIPASEILPKKFYEEIKKNTLENIRGTVQADILKEEQAQNTCIFSIDFSLRMMKDMQEYFIKEGVSNFYSVSISGYHIAEAGANPITQLALTLANGFTLLEYYASSGLKVDDFIKNFSFFFSNGIDAEYAVIGRVARRIWAIALKNIYGANTRSQKLKYHIQTSGRSLHAQEMAFNDIRTTLQAFYAITDSCNSLHTNAYDEAITTPTEESVRRAMAIQLIINHELGLTKNENPWQGSFFINRLTDMVEEEVLKIFEKLNDRGGVLGAMETMYQRNRIQEESLHYEEQKHSGKLPLVGINTFVKNEISTGEEGELRRSSLNERNAAVKEAKRVKESFGPQKRAALERLKKACFSNENVFAHLLEASKFATLGEITGVFLEIGGSYRRSM